MIEIDRLIMRKAIREVSDWRKKGFKPGVLSLNLTLQHLLTADFIPELLGIMNDCECKFEDIELEITEDHIISRPDQSKKVLYQRKEIGIKLSLDDFGTGYSSLGYLKNLPVDKIKIDRSFIQDLPHDDNDAALLNSIVALSEGLNLKVLAEGVETQDQQDMLLELGCYYSQGYFFSKPKSANDMEKQLKANLASSVSSLVFLNDRR